MFLKCKTIGRIIIINNNTSAAIAGIGLCTVCVYCIILQYNFQSEVFPSHFIICTAPRTYYITIYKYVGHCKS